MRIRLKMLIALLLCWVSFCTAQVLLQNSTYLRIGGNISHFRHETHQYRPGFQLGIAHEWRNGKRVLIGWDMLGSYKKGFYDNIKVGLSYNDVRGFSYDLTYNMVFLESLLFMKMICKSYQHISAFGMLGTGLQVGIADGSKIKRLYSIDNIDELPIFDHVYSRDPEPNIGFAISGGVGLSFRECSIELRLVRALHDIDEAYTIRIGQPLDNVSLIFSIQL